MLELFINNKRVDIFSTTSIAINKVLDSWKFSGWTNISSYSYTFDMPYTLNNVNIIFNIENKYTARIEYNSVVVFDGFAKITEFDDNTRSKKYKVNLYTETPKKISDIFGSTKLSELEYYIDYTTPEKYIDIVNTSINNGLYCFPYIYDGIPSNSIFYDEENPVPFTEPMKVFVGSDSKFGTDRIYTGWNIKRILSYIFNQNGYSVDGSFFTTKTTDNIWINGKSLNNAIKPELELDFEYRTDTSSAGSKGLEGSGRRILENENDEDNIGSASLFLDSFNLSQRTNYTVTKDTANMYSLDYLDAARTLESKSITVQKSGWYRINLKVNNIRINTGHIGTAGPPTFEDSLYYDAPVWANRYRFAGSINRTNNSGKNILTDNGTFTNCVFEFQLRQVQSNNEFDWTIPNSGETSKPVGAYKSNNILSTGTNFRGEQLWNDVNRNPIDSAYKDFGVFLKPNRHRTINAPTNTVLTNDEDLILGLKWGSMHQSEDEKNPAVSIYNINRLSNKNSKGVLDWFFTNRLSNQYSGDLIKLSTPNNSPQCILNVNNYANFDYFLKWNNLDDGDEYHPNTMVYKPVNMLNNVNLTKFKPGIAGYMSASDYPTGYDASLFAPWNAKYTDKINKWNNTEVETAVYLEAGKVLFPVILLPQVVNFNGQQENVDNSFGRGYVGCSINGHLSLNYIESEQDWTPKADETFRRKTNMFDCFPDITIQNFINSVSKAFNLNLTIDENNKRININSRLHNYSLPVDISEYVVSDSVLKGFTQWSEGNSNIASNILFKKVDELSGTNTVFGVNKYNGDYNKNYNNTIQVDFVYPNYVYVLNGNYYDDVKNWNSLDNARKNQLKILSRPVPLFVSNSKTNLNFLYYDTNVIAAFGQRNDMFMFSINKNNKINIKGCSLLRPSNVGYISLNYSEYNSILTNFFNLNGLSSDSSKTRSGQEVTKKIYLNVEVWNKLKDIDKVIIDDEMFLISKINKFTLNCNDTPTAELVLIRV